MNRPSEKASQLADELVDYVHPQMGRSAAVQEIANMVDEMNSELIEVLESLLEQVRNAGPGQHAVLLNHLEQVIQNYRPLHLTPDSQHELFTATTQTQTTSPKATQRAAELKRQKLQ